MQILRLDLKPVGEEYAELRYFFDNTNQYKSRRLPLSDIADLIQLVEQDYSVLLVANYTITERKLFNGLAGNERFLQETGTARHG